MDFWTEVTGWIGMLLVLCGRTGLAYRRRWGFLLVLIGGFAVGVQAFLMSNFSILTLAFILLLIDFQGWIYWGKKDDQD